jgi:hypothetical protein
MKKSLLFALLAFSLSAFAQTNPAYFLLQDHSANSMYKTVRPHDHQQPIPGFPALTQSQKMFSHPSREILDLIQRYDSIYMWGWDTLGSKLTLQSKISDITYNAHNLPTSLTYESWNGSGWDKTLQFAYTYDANNNETSLIFKSWNGTSWTNTFQTLYTYDANNNQITELSQYWVGAWLNASYYVYTYDGNHNLLTETDQTWTGTAWMNLTKNTYTYSNNNQTSYLSQFWNDVDAVWVNQSQNLYTYDGNHNQLTNTYQTWNGISWDNVTLNTYTYDGNNNQLTELDQTWDGTQWVNVIKTTNTFDGNHNITLAFTQAWNGANWDNSARVTNTYNGSHLLTKSLSEIWDGITWKYSTVSFYTYGENNFPAGEGNRSFDGVNNFITSGDSTHYYFKSVAGTHDLITDGSNISVSPNPSNGTFTVSSADNIGDVEIFNFLGERVYSAKKVDGQMIMDINLTGYAKGVYLVVRRDANTVSSKKILIQ